MAHHPITMQTALNFIAVIFAVFLSGYYLIRGRKIDRGMMAMNLVAGVLVSAGYAVIYLDAYWLDFATMKEVSRYVLKPINTILICVMLANILRIGKTHDH